MSAIFVKNFVCSLHDFAQCKKCWGEIVYINLAAFEGWTIKGNTKNLRRHNSKDIL